MSLELYVPRVGGGTYGGTYVPLCPSPSFPLGRDGGDIKGDMCPSMSLRIGGGQEEGHESLERDMLGTGSRALALALALLLNPKPFQCRREASRENIHLQIYTSSALFGPILRYQVPECDRLPHTHITFVIIHHSIAHGITSLDSISCTDTAAVFEKCFDHLSPPLREWHDNIPRDDLCHVALLLYTNLQGSLACRRLTQLLPLPNFREE